MTGQYLFQDYDGEEMTTAMLQALDRIAAHVDPEKHSSKELDSYGPIALAGVALAAASGDVKVDILKSICQRLSTNEHAEKTMSEFSASSLTKLCWALAVANHRDKKVMAKIGMEIASRSCEFSGEELAKCLCAFAELRFFHEETWICPPVDVKFYFPKGPSDMGNFSWEDQKIWEDGFLSSGPSLGDDA